MALLCPNCRRELEGIVERANALARVFAEAAGCRVPQGYRYDQECPGPDPPWWQMAVLAYDHFDGTDVEAALREIEAAKGVNNVKEDAWGEEVANA